MVKCTWMDVYEIIHINTTAENTMDNILKCKRIQHVNRCREMDLQKLKNYKLLESRNLLLWLGGWSGSVGAVAMVTFLSCSGCSYSQCYILLWTWLQQVLFCWCPSCSLCHILFGTQLQPLSYSVGALPTAHVIFCLGPNYVRCHILLGPSLQPMSYSGGVLGTANVVLWWGPGYS